MVFHVRAVHGHETAEQGVNMESNQQENVPQCTLLAETTHTRRVSSTSMLLARGKADSAT